MVKKYIHYLHYLFYKIKNILVIDELYVTPVDFLLGILFLLHLENMLAKGTIKGFSIYINISQLWDYQMNDYTNLVEMLLQFFVGQINAELLKTA